MHKVNQDTYARLFASIIRDPATCQELVEETGLHLVTVQSLMRCLKKHKVVHIVDWDKDRLGRDAIPVYGFGKGRDKKRERMTAAERQAAHRARKATMTIADIQFRVS